MLVLEDAWNAIQTTLLSRGKTHVARVSQLDAELLDQELVQLLLEPIRGALSLINVCFVLCTIFCHSLR
jgi:hypothetical protein